MFIIQSKRNLGYCLEKGIGIAIDEPAAVAWYRKAAEQGLAKAQNKRLCALLGYISTYITK